MGQRRKDSLEESDWHGARGKERMAVLRAHAYLSPVLGVALHRTELMEPMCKLALAPIAALASSRPGATQLSLQAMSADSAMMCTLSLTSGGGECAELLVLQRPEWEASGVRHM